MPYRPDPYSVEFEPMAADIITRAIAAHRSSRKKTAPRYVPVIIVSPPEASEREDGPDRLSRAERALQRALYRDKRIHKARKDTGGNWSLDREWGPVSGRTRTLRVRVFSDTSAARKVRRDYTRGDSYIKNPALRSTFAATQQEREGGVTGFLDSVFGR